MFKNILNKYYTSLTYIMRGMDFILKMYLFMKQKIIKYFTWNFKSIKPWPKFTTDSYSCLLRAEKQQNMKLGCLSYIFYVTDKIAEIEINRNGGYYFKWEKYWKNIGLFEIKRYICRMVVELFKFIDDYFNHIMYTKWTIDIYLILIDYIILSDANVDIFTILLFTMH